MRRYIAILAVLLVGVVAWTAQRGDLAGTTSSVVTLAPAFRANSASTGSSVDLAGFGSAMALAVTGQADNGVADTYVVLQDSASGATWAAVDSIAVDSVNNKVYEIGYQGARRFLRVIQRASGNAADTIASAVAIIRGGCRVQPC